MTGSGRLRARCAGHSRLNEASARKTWMAGTARKFTQSAQAGVTASAVTNGVTNLEDKCLATGCRFRYDSFMKRDGRKLDHKTLE